MAQFDRKGWRHNSEIANKELVDHILFDYYAEIFYYFYFSARDTIAQLLNVYLDLGILEHRVTFGSVVNSAINKNVEIKELLDLFYKSTEIGNNYRNSLTHKFPINQKDYRTILEVTPDGKKQISLKGGDSLESDKVLDNINEIFGNLSKFLIDLKYILENLK
ncbi:Cthe_2314 family HEPN domain-containing protein [Arenibacter sp. F20364]|uniref:Cthe_2314 family HEPN domain-containing protein n=1 Tax=Arenibacter sp. F20364 TaxID=2926415 RepID=UPI001FF2C5AE|nr:Cthe_2314 family HEPN domain-containing protein [Arenibacter sp. F20364]